MAGNGSSSCPFFLHAAEASALYFSSLAAK